MLSQGGDTLPQFPPPASYPGHLLHPRCGHRIVSQRALEETQGHGAGWWAWTGPAGCRDGCGVPLCPGGSEDSVLSAADHQNDLTCLLASLLSAGVA